METLKKHEDELDFFAREMACKRALHRADGETGKAWILWLYEWASNYGRSVRRPTKYLAISLVYTAFIMAAILRWRIPEGYPVLASVGEALNLTYANLLSPLNIRKDFYSATALQKLPHAIKAISAFQTVAGVFFTFLIGLALRNRFRMK